MQKEYLGLVTQQERIFQALEAVYGRLGGAVQLFEKEEF